MLVFATSEGNKKRLMQQQQQSQTTADGESGTPSSPTNYKYYAVATIPLSELMLSDSFAERGLVALEIIHVSEAIYSVSFESPEDRHAWVMGIQALLHLIGSLLTFIDIEQATVQHIKQQGKKDTLDLHHIELISANEADSLMFKRPLFDKDLALAFSVPQNLLGAQANIPRPGSFDGKGNGGGLNLSINFGKSHKHKHENVEQTKLFNLEKALRRDLDAFCKVCHTNYLTVHTFTQT